MWYNDNPSSEADTQLLTNSLKFVREFPINLTVMLVSMTFLINGSRERGAPTESVYKRKGRQQLANPEETL